MGKGDRRTRRGKIFRGSFGKARPGKTKKKNNGAAAPAAAAAAPVEAAAAS